MRSPDVVAQQTWDALTFAHWRAPVSSLRDLVPRDVTLDTFDGAAWLSLVPFRCRAFRPVFVPRALGWSFIECNVRTYVRWRGEPAIWLFSADVSSTIAKAGYALLLGGNARRAALQLERAAQGHVALRAQRGRAQLTMTADREEQRGARDELDNFLLDRFLQVSWQGGALWGMRVHHAPIVPARSAADIRDSGWSAAMRLPRFPSTPERAHYAQRVDVGLVMPVRLEAHARLRIVQP